MDFRQLRYFVAAFEQHSMSAAACVCRVAQPTLSAQVQRLELELNDVLFDRTSVGLRPTKSARRLYHRLSPLLDDALHGLRYINSGTDAPIEALKVAIDYSAASVMGLAIRHAGRLMEMNHPHWKISLHSAEARQLGDDDPHIALHVRHRIRTPEEKDTVAADTWLSVEVAGHSTGEGRNTDARPSVLDGVFDLPSLPNDISRAFKEGRRADNEASYRRRDIDAKELILSMLARNRGRVLVPRLAVSPLILHHPRLQVREVTVGLPSLAVVVEPAEPTCDLHRNFRRTLERRFANSGRDTDRLPPADLLPDTKQLRYFLRTITEGGVTRAAAKLNVVQPAVSMQISTLERSLGRKLLERSSRGIFPTAFGRKVQSIYGPILDALEAAPVPNIARRIRARPILRVGILPGLDEDSLVVQATTATIIDWQAALPNIELKVVESHSGVLLDWLSEDVIDVAVVEDLHAHTSLQETVLCSEPLAVLTASRPVICSPGPIKLADIGKLNLVLPTARHGLRALLERKFADAGLRLAPKLELDSMASAIRLVKAGGWATVMPSSAVQRSLDSHILHAHPIVRPSIMRELRAVQLARRLKKPWAKEFIDFLRARLSSSKGS